MFAIPEVEQLGYLMYIDENHVDMLKLYDEVKEIVAANQTGPKSYLYPIYKYYFPLLSNKLKEMTENIFVQTELPELPVSN